MKTVLKDIFDDGTLTNFEPLNPKEYEYVLLQSYDDLMEPEKTVLVLFNDMPLLTAARANVEEGWADVRVVRAVWADKIYYVKERNDPDLYPMTYRIYGKVQIVLLDRKTGKPVIKSVF